MPADSLEPPPTRPVQILLVDDSHLVRAGLRTVLETLADTSRYQVCGEAGSAREAFEMIGRLRPDLVLLDVRLPDGKGYDLCRSVVADFPETKVLMLTAFTSDSFIYESINAGAHGYLLKEIEPEGLLKSIEDVLAGRSALSESITDKVLQLMRAGAPDQQNDLLGTLSKQERRVLELVAKGHTNNEIATEMELSGNTVKNYLASVFDKLKIRRRSQAAAIWTQHQR